MSIQRPESSTNLDEVILALGELKGKIDSLIMAVQAQTAVSAKHEERISSLERWKAYMIGAAVASGAASGLVVENLLK